MGLTVLEMKVANPPRRGAESGDKSPHSKEASQVLVAKGCKRRTDSKRAYLPSSNAC
jgi:hypothetical protein